MRRTGKAAPAATPKCRYFACGRATYSEQLSLNQVFLCIFQKRRERKKNGSSVQQTGPEGSGRAPSAPPLRRLHPVNDENMRGCDARVSNPDGCRRRKRRMSTNELGFTDDTHLSSCHSSRQFGRKHTSHEVAKARLARRGP